MREIDDIEVSRKAHELGVMHGRAAVQYAERLAREARAKGNGTEFSFWNAVAASLRPR
jgi:hypothetical protein